MDNKEVAESILEHLNDIIFDSSDDDLMIEVYKALRSAGIVCDSDIDGQIKALNL